GRLLKWGSPAFVLNAISTLIKYSCSHLHFSTVPELAQLLQTHTDHIRTDTHTHTHTHTHAHTRTHTHTHTHTQAQAHTYVFLPYTQAHILMCRHTHTHTHTHTRILLPEVTH